MGVYLVLSIIFCIFACRNNLTVINTPKNQIVTMEVLFIFILLVLVFGIAFYFVRRDYEQLLNREIKRAQKSGQLKSVFVDNITYNLRTPLNAILGYSNMLLEEKDANMPSAQTKELADNIHRNTEQLLDFVEKLFELSKYEGITPSFTFIEVNLIELMASYRREAMNITKRDVTVRVTTDLSPHCRGILDTNFMHQLMMHILTNAANHITQGDIVIKYGNERKGLKVAVTYTGIGQAEMIGTDIYTLLQQEDALTNVNGASTLRIAMCKAIVDVLGGEFYIDTEYDKKTVASFWIPCEMKDLHKDL